MSLAGLLGALERDAETRMAADREAAAQDASAIRLESERRLGQRREEAIRVATASLAEQRAEALALATRRVRRAVLESRDLAINRVMRAIHARASTPAADAADRAELLELARNALAYVEQEATVVRVSPDLMPELGQLLGAESRARIIPDPAIPAGAVIATEDGRVTVDATLAGWLATREPELRMIIARLLEQTE